MQTQMTHKAIPFEVVMPLRYGYQPVSEMPLQRCNMNFLARFLLGGEFLECDFSGGLFCCKKQNQKKLSKNPGPKFGRPDLFP